MMLLITIVRTEAISFLIGDFILLACVYFAVEVGDEYTLPKCQSPQNQTLMPKLKKKSLFSILKGGSGARWVTHCDRGDV